jgi:drug/metabolite transporter (DMT)-like permease
MPSTSTQNYPIFSLKRFQISLPNQLKIVLMFALAVVALGGNWPVMKLGLEHISPLWFAAVRFVMGCVCLFSLQAITGKVKLPTRKDLPIVASVGLVQMMMFTALGAIAMLSVSAGRSAVLGYTTPLWVTPIALFVLRERFSTMQIAGTVIGFVGVLILLNPATMDWRDTAILQGNALLLFCSLCWALCILHLRHHKGDSNAYQLAPWQMLLASFCLIPLAYYFEGSFTGDFSATFWWVMLYMGPFATAFSFVAINAASKHLSSASMSNAMLGVPVTGLLASTVFLGETLTLSLALGGAVILGGIMCVSLAGRGASGRQKC